MQDFCYYFFCIGGSIDIIWQVSRWDAAGNKRVEPAGMFRADLERSKAIKKLGGLGDISLWTEIGKPRSRITPVSGKVCAICGQDIIFAFENNHIFSIFLWCLLYRPLLFRNLFPEGAFHEGWHSSLFGAFCLFCFVCFDVFSLRKVNHCEMTEQSFYWCETRLLCITCVTNSLPCSRNRQVWLILSRISGFSAHG